ncbi:trans-sulfuration enzyme family protein [Maritalea mediterranea]|uniref:PLP-dependent transferase n=1 Tax=Maritalea mediterranea TaxID=2909667 RepID=A0ABS9EAA8_9HYPH|nr:PLP-dependent transferase [Maritalea mediterranea]MCF4099129.1 PLP-dependent transferase [Maritalea mediterranea]
MTRRQRLETLFAQAAGYIDQQTGGVVPAIQPSTTFVRDENYQLLRDNNIYARDDNDIVRLAEKILATAENADDALVFPTGMAAIAALMRTVPAGETILMQSQIYWGTTKWVREYCDRRDIKLIEQDTSDTAAAVAAIEQASPTIVFVETPSNPWLRITDLQALAEATDRAGGVLAVDSTAAGPAISNPIDLGAHIVMHSGTKSINGHSDVLAGVLAIDDENRALWEHIKVDRHDAGAVIGSFEAYLLIRGMRTLPVRMERMSENAMAVATYLQGHDQVDHVYYPGLESHEAHELAKKQMQNGFGPLLSFTVKGDKQRALDVVGKLNLFKRATSLGGVESLVEHRFTIESTTGIPETLIRLSVGIEHIDDLIADLDSALS